MVTPRTETERAVFEVWKELRPDEAFVFGLDECAGHLFIPNQRGVDRLLAKIARIQKSAPNPIERKLRGGVRFAGRLAGRNLRRDVRAVQASRMRPRSVPVLRTRPPRFLGLHADAVPGRGRRTPNDAAGAAALQGLGRANRERTPLRADRRSGD